MLDKNLYFRQAISGQDLPTGEVPMPEIGEIRRARDIGKVGTTYWKWWECDSCRKQEWKRTTKNPSMQSDPKICKPCNIRNQKRTFMVNFHLSNPYYDRKTV